MPIFPQHIKEESPNNILLTLFTAANPHSIFCLFDSFVTGKILKLCSYRLNLKMEFFY